MQLFVPNTCVKLKMENQKQHPDVTSLLGSHTSQTPFVCCAVDVHSVTGVPHRELSYESSALSEAITQLRRAITVHHINPEIHSRIQGLGYPKLPRFPVSDKTRKGNLAEVFLAEYVSSVAEASLPVYRLRYNPNVEQSMKGDDVLVFDFESEPVRILVGEAKFRGTPSRAAVVGIVDALVRSHKAGLPVSLQFVADRLFEANQDEMGKRVMECAQLFASEKLDRLYVGLLMSNTNVAGHINTNSTNNLRNLVMISLGLEDPANFVSSCYENLEGE